MVNVKRFGNMFIILFCYYNNNKKVYYNYCFIAIFVVYVKCNEYLFFCHRGGWRRWRHGRGRRTSNRLARWGGQRTASRDCYWRQPRRRTAKNSGDAASWGSPCSRSSLWSIHPSASPQTASLLLLLLLHRRRRQRRRRRGWGTSGSCGRCCCSESTAESCRFATRVTRWKEQSHGEEEEEEDYVVMINGW